MEFVLFTWFAHNTFFFLISFVIKNIIPFFSVLIHWKLLLLFLFFICHTYYWSHKSIVLVNSLVFLQMNKTTKYWTLITSFTFYTYLLQNCSPVCIFHKKQGHVCLFYLFLFIYIFTNVLFLILLMSHTFILDSFYFFLMYILDHLFYYWWECSILIFFFVNFWIFCSYIFRRESYFSLITKIFLHYLMVFINVLQKTDTW